jgi:hypothetical protein
VPIDERIAGPGDIAYGEPFDVGAEAVTRLTRKHRTGAAKQHFYAMTANRTPLPVHLRQPIWLRLPLINDHGRYAKDR